MSLAEQRIWGVAAICAFLVLTIIVLHLADRAEAWIRDRVNRHANQPIDLDAYIPGDDWRDEEHHHDPAA